MPSGILSWTENHYLPPIMEKVGKFQLLWGGGDKLFFTDENRKRNLTFSGKMGK